MRTVAAALLVALALAPAARAADVKLDTEDQKTLYALGLALSRNLAAFNLTPTELQDIEAGMSDGLFSKEKKVELDKYMPKIQELQQARAKAAAETEKKASQPFLDKMAAEKGAKKTPSGAIYIEEKEGTGDQAKPTDKVKVHYTGKLTDGTVFDRPPHPPRPRRNRRRTRRSRTDPRARRSGQMLIVRPATPSAASRMASGSVGWACTVRAMSSALAP